MFFTLEKFQKRVDELKIRRYFGYQPVAPFTSMPGNLHVDEVYHELPEKIEGDMFDIHDFFIGRDKYLWLPDVFGYSWALPQILKLCEINTFMTTKIKLESV